MQEFLVFADIDKLLAENKRVIQERMALFKANMDAENIKRKRLEEESERIRKQLEEQKLEQERIQREEADRIARLKIEALEATKKVKAMPLKNKLLLDEAKKLMTHE